MKYSLFSMILLSFVVLNCTGQTKDTFQTIEPKLFAQKIIETQNPQILDVRTPKEFGSDHLDNAQNIDWFDSNFEKNVMVLDTSKTVFVYCLSGNRSQKASKKLSELGFNHLYSLKGGITNWNANQLSKPSDKIIGICKQEYAEMIKSDKNVLVNFYADWCEPCQKMKPYILKFQKEFESTTTIIRLDADEHKTMVKDLKFKELPALILYKNNKIVWQHFGFITESELKSQLEK